MSYDEHLISMAGGDGEPDLDAIESRAQAATVGPWNILPSSMPNAEMVTRYNADSGFAGFTEMVADNIDAPDAEFIAHARTDVPALLAMVREQRAVIERVREFAENAPKMQNMGGWSPGIVVASDLIAALTATEATK